MSQETFDGFHRLLGCDPCKHGLPQMSWTTTTTPLGWLVGSFDDLRSSSDIWVTSWHGSRRWPISEIVAVSLWMELRTSFSASQKLNHWGKYSDKRYLFCSLVIPLCHFLAFVWLTSQLQCSSNFFYSSAHTHSHTLFLDVPNQLYNFQKETSTKMYTPFLIEIN